MAQAALRFILAQPQMTVVIPTITNQAELREYAGAADVPELTEDELARVAELYERNFDVEPVLARSGAVAALRSSDAHCADLPTASALLDAASGRPALGPPPPPAPPPPPPLPLVPPPSDPSEPRPLSPSWLSRPEIGLAPDGARDRLGLVDVAERDREVDVDAAHARAAPVARSTATATACAGCGRPCPSRRRCWPP